jgi:hypothetical protein
MCPKQAHVARVETRSNWLVQASFQTNIDKKLGAKYNRKLILFGQHFVHQLFRNGFIGMETLCHGMWHLMSLVSVLRFVFFWPKW